MSEPKKVTPVFCLTLESIAGTHIRDAILKAINLAWVLNVLIAFEFNGIRICVGPNTDPEEAIEDHARAIDARIALEKTKRENPLVGHVPQFGSEHAIREIWNWWNPRVSLDTLAEFYEFLKSKGWAR